jgi:hypothetical protein
MFPNLPSLWFLVIPAEISISARNFLLEIFHTHMKMLPCIRFPDPGCFILDPDPNIFLILYLDPNIFHTGSRILHKKMVEK